MNDKRIGIAMSGGVDSTAAALLLRETNDVEGFFMHLAQPDFDKQLERVRHLAKQLDIPLHVIDLQKDFSQNVLDYFSGSYFDGKTPNPCMVCNREIKFGLFHEAIFKHSVDFIATGHYARITSDEFGYHLFDGIDPSKNQSYFLSRLTQQQLGRTLFPLGEKLKSDVYDFVKKNGFSGFEGIESQDICFLSDQNVGAYLETQHPGEVTEGPIVDIEGTELGRHSGLFRYTIGQRRGLGIPDITPWYVTGIDAKNNCLIVGKDADLKKNSIEINDLHWVSGKAPSATVPYLVRIRYSHRGSTATLTLHDSSATIQFDEPQRAITPGQYAVIYHDTEVIGSGVIIS